MNLIRNLFQKKEAVPTEAAKKPGTTVEKRKHPRYRAGNQTFLYSGNRAPAQATIVDISQGGVKLAMREHIAVGTRMEMAIYTGGIVAKALLVIKWELQARDAIVYGAEFAVTDPRTKSQLVQYVKTISEGRG
ncbi:MAG: PilZ domain-containing protein [Candidatus Xenobiia bacterium LiM19]